MPHEAKIAVIAALTECFRADEIGIWQVAVIDDIRMAAHAPELH